MLKKILKKEEGFTLAELLIVVAIIAVLVAVSIPIFTSQLEKSRESADIANLRAAKAAAVTLYLGGQDLKGSTITSDSEVYYDAQAGVLVSNSDAVKGYLKGTSVSGGCENFKLSTKPDAVDDTQYTQSDNVAGGMIGTSITNSGDVTLKVYTSSKGG